MGDTPFAVSRAADGTLVEPRFDGLVLGQKQPMHERRCSHNYYQNGDEYRPKGLI